MTSQSRTEEKTFWEIFCKALHDSNADPIIQEFAAGLKKYAEMNGVVILQKKDQDSKETRLSSIQEESVHQPLPEVKVYPSFKRRNIRQITEEEQMKKYQEEKIIAQSFISHGLNYSYISKLLPNITAKAYRCTVEAINNTNVNDIVDYLRYETKVEIERLNRDQKRTIRTRMTRIHEWLGKLDKQQLQTYKHFIRRHYKMGNQGSNITAEKATKLYRSILGTVKTPFVNVLEPDQDKKFQNLFPSKSEELSSDEYKAIIILYIEYTDIDKVRETLSQLWGYVMKYSFHSIKNALKKVIDFSISKLLKNFKKADYQIYKHHFTKNRRNLIKESEETDLKLSLYDFYLQKQVDSIKVKDLLFKINNFLDIFPDNESISKLELIESEAMSEFELVKSEKSQSLFEDSIDTEDEVKVKEEEEEY